MLDQIMDQGLSDRRLGEVKNNIAGLRRGILELVTAHVPLELALFEIRKQYIAEAVAQAKGNQCKAARALGMHRNTVNRAMPRKQPRGAVEVVPELVRHG